MRSPIVFKHGDALSIGKAAEYLVCADLLLKGVVAFPSDQGLAYDVLADVENRLIRIQVKSITKPKNITMKGRAPRIAYHWAVRASGKLNRKRLNNEQCDVIALVALDTRSIGYFPVACIGSTMQLNATGEAMNDDGRVRWVGTLKDYTFEKALDPNAYPIRDPRSHCRHGHEWTLENIIINTKGHRLCRACKKERSNGR